MNPKDFDKLFDDIIIKALTAGSAPAPMPKPKKRKPTKRKRKTKMTHEFKVNDIVIVSDKGESKHGWKVGRRVQLKFDHGVQTSTGSVWFQAFCLDDDCPSSMKMRNISVNEIKLAEPEKPKIPKVPLMDTLVLPDEHWAAINEALSFSDAKMRETVLEKWGFGSILEKGLGTTMLFYGPPGTGKTLAAQAIAEKLGKALLIIGAAEVQSGEPGGTERAIKTFFDGAKKKNKVILLDECDSLIYDRGRVGMILASEINCLLGEIEKFEGVCIFTTNNTPVLDKAMERRISLKLEFPMPTKELRLKLWQRMFHKPEALAPDVNLEEFAKFQMAGGHIKNIALNAAKRAAHLCHDTITQDDLQVAFDRENAGIKAFKAPSVYSHQEVGVQRTSVGISKEIRKVKESDLDKESA